MLLNFKRWGAATSGGLFPRGKGINGLQVVRSKRVTFEPLEPRVVLDGGPLVISEFMAVNDGTLVDEDGQFSDWIEINNPTNAPASLEGWYLTDAAADLTKWRFPDVLLEPGEYLVVFASDKDRRVAGGQLHANFKLSGQGEYLALVRPDGTTVAHAFLPRFPEQYADVSYGLAPVTTTLVQEGAGLTYRVPTDGDAALGDSWTAPEFDDTAWKGGTPPSPVLITEAGPGDPDYAEVQNVSGGPVETLGWVVAANNAYDIGHAPDINAYHSVLWELPPSMGANEVLYRSDMDDGTGNYWGTNIFWRTTGNGWLMLVDDQGNVADFVVWGYGTEEIAALEVNINGGEIRGADLWAGAPVTGTVEADESYLRVGDVDHDNASDWEVLEQSMGAPNTDLTTPFARGPSTGIGYSVDPPGLGEAIRTDVRGEMYGLNASLWTRVDFQVDDPTVLSALKLRMKYNDGFVAYLNGREIARRNAPDPLQWNSAATASRSLEESLVYEAIEVSDFLGVLQAGENVLAIHGLNDGAADEEFLILPNLVGASIQGTGRYFATPTPGGPNASGSVVINEIHYDPEDKTEFSEFIELHNTTDRSLDLSGWRFDDGIRYTFPVGTSIPAGGYVVVAEDPPTIQARFGVWGLGPWTGRLENDGEKIVLVGAAGHVEDEVDYKSEFPWPIASRGEGSSMELIHPALDNDLGGSWRASGYSLLPPEEQTRLEPSSPIDPTPGRQNSVYSSAAPPQIRQVRHAPRQPATAEPIVVTAKVTDADEVLAVTLQYQLVFPGSYVPADLPLPHGTLLGTPNRPFDPNPDFEDPAHWTSVAMFDDGLARDTAAGDHVYTAVIPGQAQNRTLVRYRIMATDTGGAAAAAPYPDDPALNFACYVYDGVPAYQATRLSVQGAGHVYSEEIMNSLPVYTLITRADDLEHCIAYDSAYQIPKSNEGARDRFNWEGAFVYDGVVYDHIHYRLRQANDRYGGHGKRSMRLRFNRGSYLAARDNFGNEYPNKWRTLNTGKMFDNKDVGNFGLTETLNHQLWNLVGVPAPWTHTFHFRVVDDVEEAPGGEYGQYYGDFWGMHLAMEDYDPRFIDTHNMGDGNLYKLKDGIFDGNELRRNQGRYSITTDDDFQNIRSRLRPERSDQWLNDHVNYDRWYWYHAVVEGIRHYDFVPADSHSKNRAWFFEPYEGSQYGRLWTLPWDSDASWGPNWNLGIDYSKNAIFASGGKPAFKQEYRNTLRAFRDLLWTQEAIAQMIDELAAVVADFSMADRDRWRNAPADAGYQDFGTMEWKVQDMKNFAFVGWSGSTGPTVPAGGRAAYLDGLANAEGDAASIPATPMVTSTSPAGFPIDGLTFRTTSFSDPQGNHTFAAMQWRIGQLTDPQAPAYDPEAPRIYEVPAVWESREITSFEDSITIPGGVLEVGHAYRVRVRMKDTSGRWSHWSDPLQLIAGAPANPVSEALRITEIMYHPADPAPAELAVDPNFLAEDFEFIELQNTGAVPLDLIGYEFADGVQLEFTPDGVTTLAPGELILVAKDLRAFEARYGTGLNAVGGYDGWLSNGGENLRLVDPFGRTVLDFQYGDSGAWPLRTDGIGSSLEIVDAGGDYDDPGNWRPSSKFGGTPGVRTAPEPGVVINEVLSHTDPPDVDAIELINTAATEIDVGGWYLSDSPGRYLKFRIPDDTRIPAGGYLVFDESDFNPTWNDPQPDPGPNDFALNGVHGDDVWLVKTDAAGKVTDFGDNVEFGAARAGESFGRWPDGTGDLYPMLTPTLDKEHPENGLNSGPRVGPVILSEVHYNPERVAEDDHLEFIEIYNSTQQTVDLAGWRVRGGIDFDFAAGSVLGPCATMLLVSFDPGDADRLSVFTTYYNISEPVEIHGPYRGQLNDNGERVRLQRPDTPPPDEPYFTPRLLEDEVVYDDQPPWPVDADGGGSSLHRGQLDAWGHTHLSWNPLPPTPGKTQFVPERAYVVGRHVFYNGSSFDGRSTAADGRDDGAIAPDKEALLPGGTATSANYTSYASGINGIMVDIAGLPEGVALDADDFRFRAGNHNDATTWAPAPAPSTIALRPGEGVGGSDRVTITWNNNSIQKQWLQVTVLATADTDLAEPDVFYFGNAVGETGNSANDAKVNAFDMLGTRDNQRTFLTPASIDFAYDFNRDARVNTYDMLIARDNQTHFLNALKLITVPGGKAAGNPEAPPASRPGQGTSPWAAWPGSGEDLRWLYEFEPTSRPRRGSQEDNLHGEGVDTLPAGEWPY